MAAKPSASRAGRDLSASRGRQLGSTETWYAEIVDSALAQRIIAHYFQDKPGIVAVYLFGSFAKGGARADSDVDVGVLFQVTPPATLLEQPFAAEADLAEELARPVQVIAMNRAPADLVHRILRDGILVLEKDKSRRIAFEVRSRNEYFDLLPMLRQYRKRANS
ncbi:MAG: nucleotidyltransferase domain-containing protein [Pseudomonadota bacterium]